MLEKLATHQVETVTTLFALADKCARAAEGRAWHSATQAGPTQTSGPSVAAPGSSKKKNKKSRGFDKSRVVGPAVVAATTGGQNPRGKRPRQQRTDARSCPIHHGARHSTTECREIQKLTERLNKRRDQASREGSSPPWRSGKEKASDADAAVTERELGYKPPTKTSRVSSTSPTPSPMVTSTARSCTSCMAAVRSSSPIGMSRPFAGRSSR
jgi:hypothetical protein